MGENENGNLLKGFNLFNKPPQTTNLFCNETYLALIEILKSAKSSIIHQTTLTSQSPFQNHVKNFILILKSTVQQQTSEAKKLNLQKFDTFEEARSEEIQTLERDFEDYREKAKSQIQELEERNFNLNREIESLKSNHQETIDQLMKDFNNQIDEINVSKETLEKKNKVLTETIKGLKTLIKENQEIKEENKKVKEILTERKEKKHLMRKCC